MDTIDIELDHIFTTWIELWVPVPVLWVYNAGSNKIKLNGYDTVRGMSRLLGNAMSALVLVFALA